jgi:hypothetical protein
MRTGAQELGRAVEQNSKAARLEFQNKKNNVNKITFIN